MKQCVKHESGIAFLRELLAEGQSVFVFERLLERLRHWEYVLPLEEALLFLEEHLRDWKDEERAEDLGEDSDYELWEEAVEEERIPEGFSLVRSLYISGHDIPDGLLPFIIPHCAEVRKFKVFWHHFEESEWLLFADSPALQNLESLEIDANYEEPDTGALRAILSSLYLKKLRSLRCQVSRDVEEKLLVLSNSPVMTQLESLILHLEIDDEEVQVFERLLHSNSLKNLQHLGFTELNQTQGLLLVKSPLLQTLQRLSIPDSFPEDEPDLYANLVERAKSHSVALTLQKF